MQFIQRVASFVGWTLIEYGRSGRALVELIATVLGFYLLFIRSNSGMPAESFFATAGVLMLLLTIYSTAMMMNLSTRPQNALVIGRQLGRSGFLVGHYLAAVAIAGVCYGLLSLLAGVFRVVQELSIAGWLLGSIPLLLNCALLAAAVLLLTPSLLNSTWRLVLLAGLALGLANSFINSQAMREFAPVLRNALGSLQLLLSLPLVPVFTGFALSVSRDYSGANIAVPFGQVAVTLGLLALCMHLFKRRELQFQG